MLTCTGVNKPIRMGQKATLWIVNATDSNLKLTGAHNSHMKSWSFSDIAANSQQSFNIEFDLVPSDAKADTTYTLQGTSTSFQVQAQYYSDARGRQIQVDWTSTDIRQYTVFPPPITGSTLATVGWINDGTLCVLIQSKPSALPSPPPLTTLGTQWMQYYSDVIRGLTLTEMCIPGTHDSGTYQPEFELGRPWIRTQSLSLRHQLDMGIRSLDLRIGQVSPGEYIITHDVWKTKYTLSGALKEVTDFIKLKGNLELVILDFHRFNALGKEAFDFVQLKAQVKSCLQGYFIPRPEGIGKTLSDLWHRPNAVKERIVIAWNDGSIDSSYMWPAIDQHWYSDADSKDKLKDDLTTDFSTTPPTDTMWTSCVFRSVNAIQTPYINADELRGTLDNWFYGCAPWTLKANILNTDFCPDFNNVIHAAICASLIKGRKK